MFEIHMGVPEMEEFWNALTETQRDALLNFIKTIPDTDK